MSGGRVDALTRLAMGSASTEPELQAKAAALVRLAAMDPPPAPVERLRGELQRVAETEALTARGQQAVLAGLGALERLDAGELAWPSETPDEPAPANYWPYDVRPARHGQEAFTG